MTDSAIERMMTIKELTRAFNVSTWTVYKAIKNDRTFPIINVGPKKNYRILPSDFRNWLAARYVHDSVQKSTHHNEGSANKKGAPTVIDLTQVLRSPPVKCLIGFSTFSPLRGF